MPTSLSSTQTPPHSGRYSRSDTSHEEPRNPPLHPPPPRTPVPDTLTSALIQQLHNLQFTNTSNPGLTNDILPGGRSRMQSPPPQRPTTPLSQIIELATSPPPAPRPSHRLPHSRSYIHRRAGSYVSEPIQPIRQPRQPPPLLTIDTSVQHIPRSGETPLTPSVQALPMRQPRPPPPVATPVFANLQAALSNNHSRFVVRLQARKAELLARIQPHCHKLPELCQVFCSCSHSSADLSILDLDLELLAVPRPENRHTWVFNYLTIHAGLDGFKEIMKMEMPMSLFRELQEVKDVLKGMLKAMDEEVELVERRWGLRRGGRWEVGWNKDEEERKWWVNGGYEVARGMWDAGQEGRRDSLRSVAMAGTDSMQHPDSISSDGNMQPAALLRRQPTRPTIHDLSMLRDPQTPESWGESTAMELAAVAARHASAPSPPNFPHGIENTPPPTLPRVRTAIPISRMTNPRLTAERNQAIAASRTSRGRVAESRAQTRSMAQQSSFSQLNSEFLSQQTGMERNRGWTGNAAPRVDAGMDREYEFIHFRPLPPRNTMTNAELEMREDARRAEERRIQRLEIWSNNDLEARELSRRMAESNLEESQRLSNADLEARETARWEAEQWQRAGLQATPEWLSERRAARENARSRERQESVARERRTVSDGRFLRFGDGDAFGELGGSRPPS